MKKYVINYVLCMAICAVISSFFKNDAHPSSPRTLKSSHNMIGDSISTDYWGLQTDLLPAVTDDKSQTLAHNPFTSYWGTIMLKGNRGMYYTACLYY